MYTFHSLVFTVAKSPFNRVWDRKPPKITLSHVRPVEPPYASFCFHSPIDANLCMLRNKRLFIQVEIRRLSTTRNGKIIKSLMENWNLWYRIARTRIGTI